MTKFTDDELAGRFAAAWAAGGSAYCPHPGEADQWRSVVRQAHVDIGFGYRSNFQSTNQTGGATMMWSTFRRLKVSAITPKYESAGAAGMDISSAEDVSVTIMPGRFAKIGTGLAVELSVAYEAQVRPRSGLAAKHGVTVLNAPGTIDSDYRGEICVILINHGQEPFTVSPGDRIAQLVIAPVIHAQVEEANELSSTGRGDGGFGSTGR